jgi:hypothetical protein
MLGDKDSINIGENSYHEGEIFVGVQYRDKGRASRLPQKLNNGFHLSSREDLAVGFVAYDLQGYESLVL